MTGNRKNLHEATVRGFGREWSRFDQSSLSDSERVEIFSQYFSIFPWHRLPPDAEGFDLGCGSGRWARLVAPRVRMLHCIDASPEALGVAKRNLADQKNCEYHEASVAAMPVPIGSMDFGYSLGVLHHVPDTAQAIGNCARVLKSGAPFLVYLYYSFDNRPGWFRAIWHISNWVRRVVSRLPFGIRSSVADVIAIVIYWPLARIAVIAEKAGFEVDVWPLSSYRNRALYTMRTDALDRFGTQLEQRFSRIEIQRMMEDAGFRDIEFREQAPYWCAMGYKK